MKDHGREQKIQARENGHGNRNAEHREEQPLVLHVASDVVDPPPVIQEEHHKHEDGRNDLVGIMEMDGIKERNGDDAESADPFHCFQKGAVSFLGWRIFRRKPDKRQVGQQDQYWKDEADRVEHRFSPWTVEYLHYTRLGRSGMRSFSH